MRYFTKIRFQTALFYKNRQFRMRYFTNIKVDLKHVIETSGIQHAEKRHGAKSNDRQPLTIEDYLLVPYIIKRRDSLTMSPQKDVSHKNTILEYTKQIGDTYYYVEEIRKKNKSLAFKSLRKRTIKKPLKMRGFFCYRWGGNMPKLAPYVLIIHWFFIPFPRPTDCKYTTNIFLRNIFIKKFYPFLPMWHPDGVRRR